MKALTIQQPWAWAIAAGHKVVENRTWRSPYRGPLAIHAGKTVDGSGISFVKALLVELGVVQPGELVGDRHLLTRGAVVAVVSRVDFCMRSLGSGPRVVCDCGPWAMPGQFHWQLKEVQALAEPFPCSGKQGLWEVDLPQAVIGGARNG